MNTRWVPGFDVFNLYVLPLTRNLQHFLIQDAKVGLEEAKAMLSEDNIRALFEVIDGDHKGNVRRSLITRALASAALANR